MVSKRIKDFIQKIAHNLGYHVLSKNCISGDMRLFLSGINDRGFKPKNILDIGANTGDWSIMASSIFRDCSYFMIEPQLEMKPYLDSFYKNHKGAWFLGGAGSQIGSLKLSVWDDLAGSSFLLSEKEAVGKQQRSVPIFTVDSLISEIKIPVPDLCKIDVQGFEIEVLKGSESIFGKCEVFILEASLFRYSPNQPLLHEVIDFMTQKGYVIYDFAGFSNRPSDKALGQIDICFVKESGILRKSNAW